MQRIAIVGASLAGTHAAQTLRRQGFDGEVVLIGDEPHYPYDRPPLSKEVLVGPYDDAKLRLRPAADPAELGVDWRLDTAAVGLELATDGGATVHLDGGHEVEADGLVIATGARPRTLPDASGTAGVHVLRTLDDAGGLKADLEREPDRVVVVGCGFIGAEVAASARTRGLDVTIIEAAPAPLVRVLDEAAGMAIADLHRSHGVDVRLGTGVAALATDEAGNLRAVELEDGTTVDATVAVIGIGVIPNTDWLDGSGLTLDDGVVTDETCLAAPGVVAVGDVARWPNRRFGGRLTRVEQWDNAVEMGGYGAKRLLASAAGESVEPYAPVPWFWSDQYDRKIQLAGIPASNVELLQGSHEEHRFAQIYLDDDGDVTGALCWNRPRQAILARQHIASGSSADEIREALG